MEELPASWGPEINAKGLIELLDQVLDFSEKPVIEGLWQLPLCIWGNAGIGKTALIHDFARERAYKMVHLAPAQIEEMGDLLGMPAIEGTRTTFRKPSWIPDEKGPGILLLDDFNRADERIIKGLMQLLQEKKMIAWSLPPKWVIVLTANPESHQYQVTPLDQATLTRMIHLTLTFDIKDWVIWAEKQKLPNWCIDFAILQQELFEQERHTPRTFSQFAYQLNRLKWDPDNHLDAILLLAHSMLGEKVSMTLKNFFTVGIHQIPMIHELLKHPDFENQVDQLLNQWNNPVEGQRVDLFSILCNRLNAYLSKKSLELKPFELTNLKHFFTMDALPADFRFILAQDWANSENGQLNQLIRDPDLASLVL